MVVRVWGLGVGGVVIAVGLVVGWNYHQSSTRDTQLAASDRFEELVERVNDGDLVEAETVAGDLIGSYGETVYASQAGIAMARLYMDQNRDQDAADSLLTVVESSDDQSLANIARLRLARIYLYQEKPEDALALLESHDDPAFAAIFGEVIGDAHAALGQVEAAEAAYQAVLADPLAQNIVDSRIVQWKWLDLPRVAETPESTGEPEADDAVEPEQSSKLRRLSEYHRSQSRRSECCAGAYCLRPVRW